MIPAFQGLVVTSIMCFMYCKFFWLNQIFGHFTENGKGSNIHIWVLILEVFLGTLTYILLMEDATKH